MSAALPISEADFLERVADYARLRGWLVSHFRPARTERGWRTAVQGDPGCPDLILARRGEVLLVELKSARGKPSSAQVVWLDAAGGRGRLWRPADWVEVVRDLY